VHEDKEKVELKTKDKKEQLEKEADSLICDLATALGNDDSQQWSNNAADVADAWNSLPLLVWLLG